jgi:hypothetical protein
MSFSRAAVALALVLTACGGGDGDSPADSGAVSYYSDSFFRGNHSLSLILFEGGLVYGFYQSDYSAAVFPQFVYAGFFVGTTDAPPNASATYRITDFNFDDKVANPATLTLTAQGSTQVSGQLAVPGGASDAIVARSETSTTPTVTATLGGTYGGYIRSVDGGSALSASLSAAGQLSASTAGGCTFTATLTPRELGNLYDTEATLSAACPSPAGHYRGHALQSYGTRNVYLMLVDNGMTHGVFVQLFDP